MDPPPALQVAAKDGEEMFELNLLGLGIELSTFHIPNKSPIPGVSRKNLGRLTYVFCVPKFIEYGSVGGSLIKI